jgi:hypothetical protein
MKKAKKAEMKSEWEPTKEELDDIAGFMRTMKRLRKSEYFAARLTIWNLGLALLIERVMKAALGELTREIGNCFPRLSEILCSEPVD